MIETEKGIGQRAISGIIWKFSEKVGGQFISFVVQIVLARILLPEDYGIVAFLTIFMAICDVIIRTGLTTALIQKKEADELDYSSVFYANLVISIILYFSLFFCAPLIAELYKQPLLVDITRILSLSVIFGALSAVQYAILSKKLQFRKSFYTNLSYVFVQGVVGIIFALRGYGPWALVFGTLSGQLARTIVVSAVVGWHPMLDFSLKRVRQLFSFGSKVLGTNLLNTIFNNIHSLIIGIFFNSKSLAFYQRGQNIPQIIMVSVDGSLAEVLYPAYSLLQDDFGRLKNAMRRAIKISLYLCLPLMLGLCAVAKPLTLVLLTEKWLPCVRFMQLTCIICCFWPLSTMGHAVNALGKSKVTFISNVIGNALAVIFIVLCIRMGLIALMVGALMATFCSNIISIFLYKKYLKYGLIDVLKDIWQEVLLAIIMFCCVWSISMFDLSNILMLVVQIAVGIAVYVLGSVIFKLDSFLYLYHKLLSYIKK